MIIANIEDYRKQCEARLPPFLYDYISGGSFQENTLRANIAELQATLLRRRVMMDGSHLNLSMAMILTGCSDVNRANPDLLLKD